MFANVVVLTYQPPEPGFFSYKIPQHLSCKVQIGQLVKVPFGKREPLGVVINLRKSLESRNDLELTQQGRTSTKTVIKDIESIAFDQPILLPYQIELLKFMANYYHAPMVNCLEAILPELPSRQLSVHSSQTKKTVNREQSTVNQTLVLVPTINRIPETLAKYPQAKNHILYHNELKASEKFAAFIKILKGQADFVFGSRSAIFAPCPNLKKIIMYDEHDSAYKDGRSPYYDSLTIADKICALTGAKLEIVDSAPKITTYANHQKEIEIPKPDHKIKSFIVSMSDERRMGNKSLISFMLVDFIRRNARIGGKTLLFLNKKAESGSFFCRNCNFQEFLPQKPNMCPNCKSYDFFFASTNIFSLAEQLKKEVQVIPKLIAVDKPFQPFYSPSPIDIATAYIFYSQTFRRYQLVAHLSADSVLNRADFTSPEQFYAQVENLKKLATADGVLLLQSYNSQDENILSASLGNYKAFYEKNLAERKTLGYPPFVLMAKLTIKGRDKTKIEEKAHILLSKIQEARRDEISILGPYESHFTKSSPQFNIILKMKVSSYNLGAREKASRELKKYFELADREWQITMEPDSLN